MSWWDLLYTAGGIVASNASLEAFYSSNCGTVIEKITIAGEIPSAFQRRVYVLTELTRESNFYLVYGPLASSIFSYKSQAEIDLLFFEMLPAIFERRLNILTEELEYFKKINDVNKVYLYESQVEDYKKISEKFHNNLKEILKTKTNFGSDERYLELSTNIKDGLKRLKERNEMLKAEVQKTV